jgi:hypothetical protein
MRRAINSQILLAVYDRFIDRAGQGLSQRLAALG